MQVAFRLHGQDESTRARQDPVQHLAVMSQRLKVAGVLAQLRARKRRGQLVVAVHPAQSVGVIIARLLRHACLAKTPELAGVAVDLLVVGHKDAAFATAHALVLVQAEGRRVAEGPTVAPAELRAMRLAAVLHDLQVVLARHRQQLIEVEAEAVQVDGDNRLRPWGDRLLDLVDIHVDRVEVDIDEDRDGVVVKDARGAAAPGVSSDEDMVARADAAPDQAHVQRRGAAISEDGIAIAIPLGELFLEREVVRPPCLLRRVQRV